jgi:membrane fusion protein, multidrug efflux system
MMRYLACVGVLAAWILEGCSASRPSDSSVETKKARLEKLRQELFKLQAEITALENEIAAQDSTFALQKAIPVSVVVLKDRGFQTRLRLQGSIDNRQAITLSAKTAGTLLRLYVQEGDYVQAGQLLAEQDAEILRKSLAELRTRLDLAKTLYEKQKKLYEEGIGSEVQYLTAKNNKESLEAALQTLEEQLKNAQIRAPQAGRVDAILVKAGELVMPGMPVLRLLSGSGAWEIKIEVPERFSGLVKAGTPIQIELPDLGERFEAPIAVISENINPISRTFTIYIRALPPRLLGRLRPGMTAFAAVPEVSYPDAFRVPIEAVQTQDTMSFVYLYNRGQARKRTIRLLGIQQGEAAIEGLAPGDTVIVLGATLLRDGQAVSITSEGI